MKVVKGSYISGYLQIRVIGEKPEHFLQLCASNGIILWEIQKHNYNECTAMVQLKDVKKIKKLRYKSNYKIRFNKKYGIPFINKKMNKKKPLLFGLLLSVILFFVLSNMIWKIHVDGVPEEIENKIHEQLASYGVSPGAFIFTVESPNQIQQLLLEAVPELLWVGVEKKGTSYYLEGVEKLIIKEEEPKGPRHLVASKNGVIKSMYVKKGLPQVAVNNFVEKGNVLVSGMIEKTGTEEEEESYEFVTAEGEVIGTTWYQANVIVPLDVEYVELTGNIEKEYRIGIGELSIPIWPWKKQKFENKITEVEDKKLTLFGWHFPIYLTTERSLESNPIYAQRTKEEAIQIGIEQVKENLMRELDKEAQIISEKVLHESIRHGKVNLSLHITVEENIAIEQPINQGD